MNDFTLDELILMYDITGKAHVLLSSKYGEEELRHYNSLKQKLFDALNDRVKKS